MFREVVFFESLFSATKWTWLFSWIFHLALLVVFKLEIVDLKKNKEQEKQIPELEKEKTSKIEVVNEGDIDPLVSDVYPLEEAAVALRKLMNRQAVGKIVLTTE